MLFTSLTYFLFLPLTFGLTYALPQTWRPAFLLCASYVFYMSWKPAYALIIVVLSLIDYVCALRIERASSPKASRFFWLCSIAANLGTLAVFKYAGFFARELNSLLAWLQAGGQVPVYDLLLPLGISFHTFQAMSYTTDVYRKTIPAEKNLVHFGLYIVWFPQMVAGPIERAASLIPQLKLISPPTQDHIKAGLSLFAWGLFKKTAIADNLAVFVNAVYAAPADHPPWASLLATYAFAFQIYCDFSAYTDLAKGSSYFFGIRLSHNFLAPYLSRSLPEFWKRWHISLSSWFFEYVFFPIVRRRPVGAGPWIALAAVFLLSGFWHGANWTFLVWGSLHLVFYAIYLVLFRRFPRMASTGRLKNFTLLAVNFHLVCLGWIFFRSPSVDVALTILERIAFTPFSGDFSTDAFTAHVAIAGLKSRLALAGFFVLAYFRLIPDEDRPRSWKLTSGQVFLFCLGAFLLATNSPGEFIYFQF